MKHGKLLVGQKTKRVRKNKVAKKKVSTTAGLTSSDKQTIVTVNQDNTKVVLNAIDKQIATAMAAVGTAAVGYAKKACPVDTGRLRNSIVYQLNIAGNTVWIGTNVEYARYVEQGTSKQKAQPYLVPAAKNHGSTYRKLIKEALQNA